MPLVLSEKNCFRGIYSQREIVIETIKSLLKYTDQDLIDNLFLRSDSGRIVIGEYSYLKFTYNNFCKELRDESRIVICDSNGDYQFAVWLSSINEVFYSTKEKKEQILSQSIEIERDVLEDEALEEEKSLQKF